MTAADTRLADALADRYVLDREIGRGGMATVYVARDRKHDRRVAVKVLRPELTSSIGASRFLREIAITARLQHPHVLTLIDSGEVPSWDGDAAERLYYVMPFVEGESLRDRLARGGRLPVAEATRLLREVADALSYAHTRGVVHRDIKPENVLLAEGHALVVDFGIAKAMQDATLGDALTMTGMSIGTPAYMAPEQAAGDPGMDHRADVYATGVLAYEMLAGRPPFTGSPQSVVAAHLSQAPDALDVVRPEVPSPLARVVARCLQKEPADRFATAAELRDALDALVPSARAAGQADARSRGAYAAAAAVAVAAIAAVGTMAVKSRRATWARDEALPAIQRLTDVGEVDSAFALARRVDAVLPGDSLLAALWPRISYTTSFHTEPSGARVSRARFDDTTYWEPLGATPLDSVRVPTTMARYRFELPGRRTVTMLAGGRLVSGHTVVGAAFPSLVRLARTDAPDSDMVRVSDLPDRAGGRVLVGEFLMDRREVTNRDYRRFVDAGGYARRELWTEPFVEAGRTLSWREGIAGLVDRTGRPGPATWEGGAPVPGTDDLPVTGVSWYEAAAYARFAGKQLPTIHHWRAAAVLTAAAYTAPGSNFESSGPVRANAARAMSPWGVFDMAGNVREWCLNADTRGQRYVLGGGWTDLPFRYTDPFAAQPLDRSPVNGIRLARYDAAAPAIAGALAPVQRVVRDYATERPVPDAVFTTLRQQYDYDPAPLAARVELRDTSSTEWIREGVSFAAPAGGGRVNAVVFLPKHGRPPYQTLVMLRGGNAFFERSGDAIDGEEVSFFLRSGRAVVVPILAGMYDRNDGRDYGTRNSMFYRDVALSWGRDVRRTVDWIASRPELDATRIGYYGISFGGRMGGLMLGVEPRFRTGVLLVAGLGSTPVRPEVDPLNFLPRIRVPVLMLNGKYDDVFPTETSQRPFFELLGTPAAHKKYVLYEQGHTVPRAQLVTESLAWLDRYLGVPAR